MSRRARSGLLIAGFVACAVAIGPRPTFDDAWVEPALPDDLDAYVDSAEATVADLRTGDGREIVRADPRGTGPTPLSLVYLHGFSADRHELEPVLSELGEDLGANVYFARLTGHGRDGAAMGEATVEAWLRDTAEAVAIGERIGDRVILVGTSTGGTLAAWAAARPETEGRIAALVLVSPNLQPKDRSSRVLLYPWGGLLASVVIGERRCFQADTDGQERHWTTCYPTSALVPMMGLVEHVRTMDWTRIDVPILLIYSPDDAVVDAAETDRVLSALPEGQVRTRIIEGSTDPMNHVLAGDIVSPASNDEVRTAIADFIASALER